MSQLASAFPLSGGETSGAIARVSGDSANVLPASDMKNLTVGGKHRKSRKNRKSRKSRKHGGMAHATTSKTGGKRRKSRRSRK